MDLESFECQRLRQCNNHSGERSHFTSCGRWSDGTPKMPRAPVSGACDSLLSHSKKGACGSDWSCRPESVGIYLDYLDMSHQISWVLTNGELFLGVLTAVPQVGSLREIWCFIGSFCGVGEMHKGGFEEPGATPTHSQQGIGDLSPTTMWNLTLPQPQWARLTLPLELPERSAAC